MYCVFVCFLDETDATDTPNLRSLGSAIGFGSGSEEENYTRSRRMRCNKRAPNKRVPSTTNIVGRALLVHHGECHVQSSLRVSPRQVSHSVSARAHAKDMTVWWSHPTGFVLGSAKVSDQALCGIGFWGRRRRRSITGAPQ